jgi:hypothetical protein
MGRVFYDLAAKGGEYEDREGKKKHRFQPMGTLVVEDDGRMWGILKVLGLETQFSVFPQQDRDSGSRSGGSSSRQVSNSPDDRRPASGRPDIDDDIPF